jgi:hypothetical protein
MCLVLYVALSVALRFLVQMTTGKSWFFTSLAIPFLLVSVLYAKLEEWFGTEREGRSGGAMPPETTPADRGAR